RRYCARALRRGGRVCVETLRRRGARSLRACAHSPPDSRLPTSDLDQELQLAKRLFVRAGTAQVRLAQRGSRNGERVDRIGLPVEPPRPPLRSHQLRRHPHQLLAGGKQLPLERSCQLPAISRSSRPRSSTHAGATDERTHLNRGSSHAPIRSRSTVSDGGGDTTLASQPSGDMREMESAAADRVCANYRTL